MENIRKAIDDIEANIGAAINELEGAIDQIDDPVAMLAYINSALDELKEIASSVY